MTYPPTIIGKFTPQPPEPEPPKYETLADVPPFVAVESSAGLIVSRDGGGNVLAISPKARRLFLSASDPRHLRIHSVLGPITAIQFGGEVQDG